MTDPVTRITVQDPATGTAISRDLWGVFFEDINHAADGGLYAELVRNRSFDFSEADRPGWNALTGWTRSGPAHVQAVPATADERAHVRIAGGRGDGISNSGFDGMVVRGGEDHPLRVIARGGALTAWLEDDRGVLAEAVVGRPGAGWTELRDPLRPTRDSADARLVIALQEDGAADVGFVSLFPPTTFRDEPNGLRVDLAQTIADLRPRFVRFPGGCVAHGLGLENVYRWPRSIGPVEDRAGMFNLWGYHQSLGLGYLEYFLFCEQIGAKPLPVLAAGVCCQNLPGGALPIPDDEMDAYVREVLDLVEFANGDRTTRWGAIRAAAGHPEPFGLEYLGIGNEDAQTDTFRDRFARIWDAVHEHHPEIVVVGTVGPSPFGTDYDTGWAFARELDLPLVDEHSYKSPRWLFENLDRYDGYDRSGPAVYLGEYGSKGNTILNALAEAAYMGGMERNGDIVRLASYAPLLAKIDRTQWVPDLVYFDNERVLPTVNYWVQKMFADTAGDVAVGVSVADAPTFERTPMGPGRIAFRSPDGRAVLRDLRVVDASGATIVAADRVLVDHGETMLPDAVDAHDYVITGIGRLEAGAEGFVVAFGPVGTPDFFEWNFGTWRNRAHTLFQTADGFIDELSDQSPFHVEIGRDYRFEIRVEGRDRRITCTLDGEVVHSWERPTTETRFSATSVLDSDAGALYVRIVNATGIAVLASVDLPAGFSPIDVATLSGDPAAGAAFESAPATPVVAPAPRPEVPVPGHSFVVVRCTAGEPS